MNTENNLKFDLAGLPPVKAQYNDSEKIQIASAAKEYGFKTVAKAYGLKWQTIASWTRKKKKPVNKNSPVKLIIQSPTGQEITPEEIITKLQAIGNVDTVYIRAEENAAYWVRGEEHGSISLW